ncbi:MAG: hypothetical protein V4697_03365 [Patescibacteria group bacterium]
MKYRSKYVAIITSTAILTISGVFYYIYKWEYRIPVLDVHFLSLERGRAIFIRTPQNKTILIGGGQNSQIIRELTSRMPFYRRNIDTIIIPSATPSQIGGLIEVVQRYEVDEIIMPKLLATSTALSILMKEIRKQKIHVEEVERGDGVEIEKGIDLFVLFPYKGFKFNKTSLPELGLRIDFEKTSVYLLGNLSKTIQKDIVKNFTEIKSENILEYYHLGAPSKVSVELAEAIDPFFTFTTKEKTAHLISDGQFWGEVK